MGQLGVGVAMKLKDLRRPVPVSERLGVEFPRYFRTADDAENFREELAHLMISQKACFNSPVWFNVGVKEPRGYGWYYDEASAGVRRLMQGETRPQCSACFINSVGDTLESILEL